MQTAIDSALRNYADRIVHLHDSRDEVNGDIREVYGEAKGAGFDTTILREIVKELRQDPEARHARYQLLGEYRVKLGMLADTPLGAAAMERAEREPAAKPRPFAEQPLHRGRGRPRKDRNGSSVDDALDRARAHLEGEPAGSA